TPGVFHENDVIAAVGVKAAVRNGIRKKSQLLARSASHGNEVKLRGLRKPRRNQHFMPRWMPVRQAGAAKRSVTTCRFGPGRGNLGNTVKHQAFRRCNMGVLLERGQSRRQRDGQKQTQPFHPYESSVEKREFLYTPSRV